MKYIYLLCNISLTFFYNIPLPFFQFIPFPQTASFHILDPKFRLGASD